MKNLKLKEIVLDNIEDFLCIITDEHHDIIYPDDAKQLNKYCQIISNPTDVNGIYHIKETDEWFELYSKNLIFDKKPIVLNYFRNISRFKRLEREIQIDFTGISNRNLAIKDINDYLEYSLGNDQEFCVLLSDIDNFKNINDTYGHLFGDLVLKNIGTMINQNLRNNPNRSTDIAGRFGGDEFFGLIKNISLKDSLNWREKAKKIINNYKHVSNDKSIVLENVSMSIGLYHVNHDEIAKLNSSKLSIDDIRKYIYDKCDEYLYADKAKNHFKLDMEEERKIERIIEKK